MKKKPYALFAVPLIALILATSGYAQSDPAQPAAASDLLTSTKTTQYFTDEAVPDADVEKILLAGINTSSAMNQQPWHFSVVTDSQILQGIADEMSSFMPKPAENQSADTAVPSVAKAGIADAPLAIVISCKEGSELDAGLACQSMFLEAKLLGYGAKIISSPKIALNGDKQETYRELLGIPEGQAAQTVLLVGKEDFSVDAAADGYTGPSVRNPLDDMVTWTR